MSTISISTSNTVATLGGLLGLGPTEAILTAPSLTGVTVDLGLGAISNFTVVGSADSTLTVNQEIAAVSSLTIDTNGADVTLEDSAALSAGALSGTTIDIDNGGTFQIGSDLLGASILNNAQIHFGSGGGTDIISKSAGFIAIDLLNQTSPITGFNSATDVIDDQALNFADITGYSITAESSGVQTVTVLTSDNSNLTFAVDVATLPQGTALSAGSFTSTNGPLHLNAAGAGLQLTVCFLAGTMIATPKGETAIEDLQRGDLVLTADGRTVPVRWIGINTVATRFADPRRNMPIRIFAGALGENLPKRDLLVSPDHALLLNGILVQAGALINDTTIIREPWMPALFCYYHVEVAAHDLILAEGVAAETFVDNVSRMVFDNWEEYLALCEGEPPTGEMAYARVKAQRQLPEVVRTQLAARAERLHNRTAA